MNNARSIGFGQFLEVGAAWLLAIVWLMPLVYAFWSAFHPAEFATRFSLLAPLTLENFREVWDQAPFARIASNTPIESAIPSGLGCGG